MTVADWPHYVDDPLVDRGAHTLTVAMDVIASARAGRDLYVGGCSCGGMAPTPPWDLYAAAEMHEVHMGWVQVHAHSPGPER